MKAKKTSKKGRAVAVGSGRLVGPRPTTVFLHWISNRTALAESCERAAAKRGDYRTALRFEHEHNALVPVLDKARAALGYKNQRQPRPNVRGQPRRELARRVLPSSFHSVIGIRYFIRSHAA